jgi:hypothetical protein
MDLSLKELVPMDVQASFTSSKEQIRCIHNSIDKMKDIADRLTMRTFGKFGQQRMYDTVPIV